MSDMDEVSRTAYQLQARGMISGWLPQLPYLDNKGKTVIPIIVYQADSSQECSSEATSSDCSSGQPFLHEDSILIAFGKPVGNQPAPLTLSEQNAFIPPSPQFYNIDQQVESQLHITTNARVSNRYTQAMNEGRLSYHDPSLPKAPFLREDADDGSSTWLPPQHFIVQVEFDSTDGEAITVPDSVTYNAFNIGNTLDKSFPEYIWIYRFTRAQRISPQRVAISFMFDYYSTSGTTINLEDLQLRSITNPDDQIASYRFIHWQPMRINTVTPTQLAEEERAQEPIQEPSRDLSANLDESLSGFRLMVRRFGRAWANFRH
ncbi:hypothetical protein NX722_00545 [Endozoicomonas gorgoniicola]|uniref:Uncharacterized protein n=1 Tax=Endozoicomonas gorgoniicola TaxID=1234144 RepID=A0ABT3MP74_9GAMM|nr:hypothetical protein [Endozoicomonas gorgoniicola]MCW7551171.1 hypothetical protein [Endozoicomonas gorgoniicola]